MKKNLENIKFNLTPDMSLELVKFNELKKEYNILKEKYDKTNDERTLIELTKLDKVIGDCKTRFIEQFRIDNERQIKDYLKYREDQK